jgi:hypothetical protein
MSNPLPVDVVYATILVSFIIAIISIIAGMLQIKMVDSYNDHLGKRFGEKNVSPNIVKSGYRLSLFSMIVGAFFLYRIAYVVQTGNDFGSKDWFLYDLAIGFYMLFNSLFLLSLFKERKRLDAQEQEQHKLSEPKHSKQSD